MALTYPYVASAGPLVKAVEQLRKSFPAKVTTETLQKLGIAPKNESYVINCLRFLGVINEAGEKVDDKAAAFLQHKDSGFEKEMESLVREAYEELFELHNDDAWALDRESLTQFFRTTDHSTEVVGKRQALTFRAFASLAGKAEKISVQPQGNNGSQTRRKVAKSKPARKNLVDAKGDDSSRSPETRNNRIGLTVRVEVNLPAQGDQATYDMIFASIRKNFIDAS